MTKIIEGAKEAPDSVFVQFSARGEETSEFGLWRIRRWQVSPFDGAIEFRRVLTMADFPSTGNEEAEWIEHNEHSCEFCNGSGHKDDYTAAATEIASLRRELDAAKHDLERLVAINSATLSEVEEARDALEKIADWCNAYPLTVFPEPDMAKAATLLKAGGITLDAVSASNMRHVLKGVAGIVVAAIRKLSEPE